MTQFGYIDIVTARLMGLRAVSVRLPYDPEFRDWIFDEVMRMRSLGRRAEAVDFKCGIQLFADLKYNGIDPTGKDKASRARIWASPEFITGYELDKIRARDAKIAKAKKND